MTEREARLMAVREKLMTSIKAEIDAESVTPAELLALLSHTVGACIAMQDQRRMTGNMAMEIVAKNIEAGNAEVCSAFAVVKPKGSA